MKNSIFHSYEDRNKRLIYLGIDPMSIFRTVLTQVSRLIADEAIGKFSSSCITSNRNYNTNKRIDIIKRVKSHLHQLYMQKVNASSTSKTKLKLFYSEDYLNN